MFLAIFVFFTKNASSLFVLYLPVSSFCYQDKKFVMVPFFPHSLNAGSSVNHCWRLTDEFRVSYTDRKNNADCKRNTVLYWYFSITPTINDVLWTLGSLLAKFCSLWFSDFLNLSSFTPLWTILYLSVLSGFAHCWKCDTPTRSLPVNLLPNMSLNSSMLPTWSIAVMSDHLRPGFV